MLELFVVLVYIFGAATRKVHVCSGLAILTKLTFFSTFCHLRGRPPKGLFPPPGIINPPCLDCKRTKEMHWRITIRAIGSDGRVKSYLATQPPRDWKINSVLKL